MTTRRIWIVAGVALAVGLGLGIALERGDWDPGSLLREAAAAGDPVTSPLGVAPNRYVYYPGTEELAEGEIRVVACGTGMPAARRGQAASCWLFEFGNGEKLIFDLGTGSMANVAAQMIPYQYLDKVFLSHLHTDHMGDIDALWAGGWTSGRPNALRVWGPSGATPEMGTKYAMENFLRFCNWDAVTRSYKITPEPGKIEIHEFDYKGINQVVYESDGITVRSIPAIHAGDGPVSFIIEYAGLKTVFGGDTFPNKWFVEHCKDADFVIHECMMTPAQYVKFYNQPPQLAWRASGGFHTSPPAFGKVMSMIEPRHAVAYHFFDEEGTRYEIYEQIRTTYDGPLSMATDGMVWNITKSKITERMAVDPADAWSVPGTAKQPPPVKGLPDPLTDWTKAGELRKEIVEAQGNLMRTFWKDFDVQLADEVKAAYGVR